MPRASSFSSRTPIMVKSTLLVIVACLCLVLPATANAGEPAASKVAVWLRAQGTPTGEALPPVRAIARWYGSGKVEPQSVNVSPGTPSFLQLRPGRWTIQAEAPGYWGSPEAIELGTEVKDVFLDLWPAGTIEGGFLLPKDEEPPSALIVFFRSAPGTTANAPAPSDVLCPVEEGSWRCTLPVGVLDLRFQAGGFIPRYQWGISVSRKGTTALGKLDLARGSAVLGWVVTADRSKVAAGTRAELRPRAGGSIADPGSAGRMQNLTLSAPVNERGFFQVEGVPPGAYVVEVKQPPFAPATATVRVVAGEVTEVANPPLLLDFPQVLEVHLDPPLDPWGDPWAVRLSRLDRLTSIMTTFATESADEGGSWSKPGLAKGSYLLRVGPRKGDTWKTEEIEIDDSLSPLYLDLEVVRVAGTVHLGETPLPATLTFGGRFGADKIKTLADDEGRFELYLPRTGEWPVHISSEAPPVTRELAAVLVEPAPGKDVAEVSLRLPDTLLRGTVKDEHGKAVSRALVNAKGTDGEEPVIQTWTGSNGEFELAGLPSGTLRVEAVEGELSSEQVQVQLSERDEPAPLVLVVRPRVRVTGTVVSAAGAVPGARIKAAPVGVRYFGVRTVTSDAQGRFEVSLPPTAREMFLAVAAPGFAFRMLRLPVPKERHIHVGVEQSSGTLVLETDVPHREGEPSKPAVYVFHQGSLEGLPILSAWALASGALPDSAMHTVIPYLEPGDYRACWILPAERAGIDHGIVPQGRCADGNLAANGSLTLKLPSPPPSSQSEDKAEVGKDEGEESTSH